jgi:hypothetical protein
MWQMDKASTADVIATRLRCVVVARNKYPITPLLREGGNENSTTAWGPPHRERQRQLLR